MKIQFTRTALKQGWAIEGEEVTAKEIKEAVQDDILNYVTQNMGLGVLEGPLGKFQGTNEYMTEFYKQINRVAKLFGYREDYIEDADEKRDYDPLSR